jgi:hypothetical protein
MLDDLLMLGVAAVVIAVVLGLWTMFLFGSHD